MRLKFWLAVALALLVWSAAAQDDFPLMILVGDRVINADGTPSTCPFGVVSPDGRYIAYVEVAPFMQTYYDAGGAFGGAQTALDMWLCEVSSGNQTVIAEQPPEAAIEDASKPDHWTARSSAVWSVDGSQLVWGEVDYPPNDINENRLIVHDLASGENRLIADGIQGPPITSAWTPRWLTQGVAVITTYYDPESGKWNNEILVYDPQDGSLIAETLFLADDSAGALHRVYWGQAQYYGSLLAAQWADEDWMFVDPMSGEQWPMDGQLELYNPMDPHGTSLLFAESAEGFEWQIVQNGVPQTQTFLTDLPNDVAISPDGRVAFVDEQDVYVSSGSGYESIELPNSPDDSPVYPSVLWGPLAWRVFGEPPITQCPGFVESRLVIGQYGREMTGTPSNLRIGPGTSYQRSGEIAGGGEFYVIDGPYCADDLAWWLVNYDGTIGYTAEGQGETYWLEPVE